MYAIDIVILIYKIQGFFPVGCIGFNELLKLTDLHRLNFKINHSIRALEIFCVQWAKCLKLKLLEIDFKEDANKYKKK